MTWIILIISGLMETGCIVSLKFANGFTNLLPVLFYTLFGFSSAFLLSLALKTLPLGISFLIWMGTATIGVVISEFFIFEKTYSIAKIIFMLLILIGILGLKFLDKT
jgi:quaternary ammonium compound-resistance protein SugE